MAGEFICGITESVTKTNLQMWCLCFGLDKQKSLYQTGPYGVVNPSSTLKYLYSGKQTTIKEKGHKYRTFLGASQYN